MSVLNAEYPQTVNLRQPRVGRRRAGADTAAAASNAESEIDLTRLDELGDGAAGTMAQALFSTVDQAVALLDCRGAGGEPVYVATNPGYLATVGRTEPELLGRRVADVFPGAATPEARGVIHSILASGVPHRDEYVVQTPAGRRRFDSTLVPVGPPGAADHVLVLLRDHSDIDRAQSALVSSEQRFATLADASPAGIFATDAEGNWTYTNEKLREIAHRDELELLGRGWTRTVHPENEQRVRQFLLASVTKGEAGPVRFQVHRPDGTARWVEIRVAEVTDADGERSGFVGTAHDVTEEVDARRLAEEVTSILAETSDLVGVCGADGRVRWMNAAAIEFHGTDDLGDLLAADLYAEWARRKLMHEVLPALRRYGRWSGEMAVRSLAGGRELHVHQSIVTHYTADGTVESYSSIARDISERKQFEDQLSHQALHDPLTGLPNRPLLMDRLGQALARAARVGNHVAILSLDVDRFKVINDSLGHDAGDQLLKAVAHRLQSVLRPTDTIARLAGDEFAILCEDAPRQGIDIAERVEEAMAAPFVLDEGEIFLTVSMGIAVAQTGAIEAERMLRDADAAMYRAKEKGRARYEIVDERLRTRAAERTETETALRRALDQDDLVVHYQPLISLTDGSVVGIEALARWRHPDRGLLLPADFIPVAEEAGLIVALGERVLRAACNQVAAWKRERPDWEPVLWINLSARQLNHLALFDTLRSALDDAGLAPERLGLEITESVLMEDAEATVGALRDLTRLGVGVAIDDFGTGYSSLTYLRRFPVTTLKVDRTFVDGLGREPEDSAIVSAQVSMSHALGLSVIAEGVETNTQLDQLRDLGCDYAQGYLFAPPLPPGSVGEMLDLHPRW